MALLQSGVDIAVIALWLGHESIETTNVYVHANLAMKKKALAKVAPIGTRFLVLTMRTVLWMAQLGLRPPTYRYPLERANPIKNVVLPKDRVANSATVT